MPSAVRVVVNADDLGLSAAVNAEIFRLMETGRVTSATLLANAPATAAAAREMRGIPSASCGIHLNLTEFAPLTGDRNLGPLLDAGGRFNGRIRAVALSSAVRHAVRREWNAQIGRLRDLGVEITHIDSHHHSHTIPSLFSTLKAVQSDSGIRRVRISKNLYRPSDRPATTLLAKKKAWNFLLRRYVATRTADAFTDFRTMQSQGFLDTPPGRVIELMVHPGSPEYADETALLEQEWWSRFAYGIRLISYREI